MGCKPERPFRFGAFSATVGVCSPPPSDVCILAHDRVENGWGRRADSGKSSGLRGMEKKNKFDVAGNEKIGRCVKLCAGQNGEWRGRRVQHRSDKRGAMSSGIANR